MGSSARDWRVTVLPNRTISEIQDEPDDSEVSQLIYIVFVTKNDFNLKGIESLPQIMIF